MIRQLNPHHSFTFGKDIVKPIGRIQSVKPLLGAVHPAVQAEQVKSQIKRGLERAKM